jgi:hypothetical protein
MFAYKICYTWLQGFYNFMIEYVRPDWFRNRGYLHLSNHKDLNERELFLLGKIRNHNYVARHAFFPLIHSVIKERRFKKINSLSQKRAHSHKNEKGAINKNYKERPLHYATHIDAMIFGYYAELLLKAYEETLIKYPSVSESVIAYRKIQIAASEKNKSTIHFAHEVFEEIKKRSEIGDCCVLKFDIKSFFSRLDHSLLKEQWARVIQATELPHDHYNVFKAATKFSYIMRDDLRMHTRSSTKKGCFNEKELSKHRKKGIQAFFESPEQLRNKIKSKEIIIHRFPFRNKAGEPVGIPQGLPISAALANIYLLDFDIKVITEIVNKYTAYYRRYSDDIIVICQPNASSEILNCINQLIEESKVEISLEKTEEFRFCKMDGKKNQTRLTSIRTDHNLNRVGVPFTYLGFEFYGYKTLVKSHNVAKFYRRLISSVKSKCNIAIKQYEKGNSVKPIVYRRQLYRLYTDLNLNKKKIYTNRKWLQKNELGIYSYKTRPILKEHRSNYFSYLKRASDIMHEPAIKNQARNHMKIFNQAVQKHLKY